MRILGLAIAVAAVVPLMSMSHASAQPVAGAHYSGSITSAGDIDFAVSAGGDEILNLRVTDIPCDGATHDAFAWPPVPIPISDDQFDATLEPLDTRVTGQFLAEGSAEGTFLLDLGDCQSPELDWTATSSFPTPTPPPAVGGIAELPGVSDPSAASYLVLAGLAAAALVALMAGGWYARRRWLR
jgi:hypothetical protein